MRGAGGCPQEPCPPDSQTQGVPPNGPWFRQLPDRVACGAVYAGAVYADGSRTADHPSGIGTGKVLPKSTTDNNRAEGALGRCKASLTLLFPQADV
jgi:hypothetical protein